MSTKISLIGCGKMGSALLSGWLERFPDLEFGVVEPGQLSDALENKVLHKHSAEELAAYIKDCAAVILAVKPQIMSDVCIGLKPFLPSSALVLSIAAGQSLANFESYLSPDQPIVRAMPNTPAAIGQGMSVAIANAAVTEDQKNLAADLLGAAGLFEWVEDESLLNAVTAVSGSGPAYIFYFIEALEQAALEAGLPAPLATTLARQTVIGSAALAADQADTPAATLRENVTSPGGTTAAALDVLMNGEFQDILTKAILAAKNRGEELS
ncbi:MAG: pyrroline-5-carboxylate reductase [Alphaproteobacteria bacterium]|nr:pyrroline-5-carboxylate reductase [Alphaproteobacteria bacterium]